MLRDHYDAFVKKHYDKLQTSLDIDEDDVEGGHRRS